MELEWADYRSQLATAENALAVWHYQPLKETYTRVIPDGCVDYIIYQDGQSDTGYSWMLSELSTSTYQVHAKPGERMQGVRLKAGVRVDIGALQRYLQSNSPESLLASDAIDEFCIQCDALSSTLQCLAWPIQSIASAAKELGISTRTLQRLVMTQTGRPPHFWLSLARARRAAKGIDQYERLVDAAVDFNYSDQAHLCREMQRWFSLTPNQIKNDSELKLLLADQAYI